MAVVIEDDLDVIMCYAIANAIYKAIGKKRECGVSYLTLHRYMRGKGVNTEVVTLMADIELEEY